MTGKRRATLATASVAPASHHRRPPDQGREVALRFGAYLSLGWMVWEAATAALPASSHQPGTFARQAPVGR